MRTIGLIGGISWESTRTYYQLINKGVRARLGGSSAAQCLLYSFNFAEVQARQEAGAWDELTRSMVDVARRLEAAGADCLVICANTMHRMADDVQAAVDVPLLHIADTTAAAIQAENLQTVGLLGTTYTMEHDFYKSRLADRNGLTVLVPDATTRAEVHRVIYDELVQGIVNPASRDRFDTVIADLVDQGAQGVILGCTEFSMLLSTDGSPVPLFDTLVLHADAAVDFALG